MKFSAVILAGGQSRRMGRDKAWLEVGGQTLLARQVQLVREAGAAEVFISGRADTDYSVFGCAMLFDRFPDAGPLAGIERALAAASSLQVLVLAVDLPNMTASLLRGLAARCVNNSGVIPRMEGRLEPLAAFYPKSAGSLAANLLGEGLNAATSFAERCVENNFATFVDLPVRAARCFANWNAPADAVCNLPPVVKP